MFYYSVTPQAMPHHRFALHSITIFCATSFMVTFGLNALFCQPIKRNWTLDVQQLCITNARREVIYTTFSSHMLADIALFIFPLSSLNAARHVRCRIYGIVFLYIMGFLSIGATLARTAAIIIKSSTSATVIWSSFELATGVIIACSPELRNFFWCPKAGYGDTQHMAMDKYSFGKTATSSSITNQPTQIMMHSEIWDGSEATAPEWVRLDVSSKPSSSVKKPHILCSSTSGLQQVIPDEVEINGGPDAISVTDNPCTSQARIPPLQSGNVIVRHSQLRHIPRPPRTEESWMSLPDPLFLTDSPTGEVSGMYSCSSEAA